MARAKQRTQQQRRANQQRSKPKQGRPGHPTARVPPEAPHEAFTTGPSAGPRALPLEERHRLAEHAEALAVAATESMVRGDPPGAGDVLARLVALAPGPSEVRVVQQTLVRLLRHQVRVAWERGWQPVDVHEWVGRRTDGFVARLAGSVMADEIATYGRATVDPEWYDQLSAIGARVWWKPSETWAEAHATGPDRPWPLVLEATVVLFAELVRLVPLEHFLPLPGHARRHRTPPAHVDPKVLQRVRRLLAQAESTSFDGEAESFTAAAQRMMARHSIDVAMLEASGEAHRPDEPTGRRIWVERPYVKEKVLLLSVVAGANRVRAVWFKELEVVTLLGHLADLEAVETLYTSLLMQADRSMQAEGARVTSEGHSRTRGFRQSFLIAYATRIGERLDEVCAQETRAAAAEFDRSSGAHLLPVLQAREEAVDAYAATIFPHQRHARVSAGSDGEGWSRGRSAADRARLASGPSLEG